MRQQRTQYAGTVSRRREIVDAALECFVEMGFVDTTMEDIRARSGASNGSVYHHFKSKERLAAEVYVEGIADYQNDLLAALAKRPGAREGIYAIVRHHLRWVDANRVWAKYLFASKNADFVKSAGEPVAKRNREFGLAISKWYEENVETGAFRKAPLWLCLSLILGPCQDYAKRYLAKNGAGENLEAAAVEIAEAAWRALGGVDETNVRKPKGGR